MKITKIEIEKFRGFKEVGFDLGSQLTVISGQNGTQKTTLLGLLTQPFTISDSSNPMYGERPLSGENYKSDFSEKFKFSDKFDKIGDHKWTLYFDDSTEKTVGSIDRGGAYKGEIRIWDVNKKSGKADKSSGTGYVQLPVIYLSLKRLMPIGEDDDLKESKSMSLTAGEINFFLKWHNKILLLNKPTDKITDAIGLESPNKQTLGANTDYYDWQVNSAGQDNIGKILLAILSFKRLKEKYPEEYKGGILAIDEVDATLFPASQIKLLNALIKFASDYQIQIICTTHSLTILKDASLLHKDPHRKNQINLIFLEKSDGVVKVENDIDYKFIENSLNKTLTGSPKIEKTAVYTEDPEGAIFAKSLLGNSRTRFLKFHEKVKLGSGNLIQLSSTKVPTFIFPNSIILLDGDVKGKELNRAKRCKNIMLLPGDKPIEQLLADYLNILPDADPLWKKIDLTFDKQYCFNTYEYDEVMNDREKAKKWFNEHLPVWGRNANKVLNPWKKANEGIVEEFRSKFDELLKKY